MTTTTRKTRRMKSAVSAHVAASLNQAHALAGHSQVGALRLTLGMPRHKFARLMGRTERAIVDWETGKTKLQGLSQQRVNELNRLTEELKSLFAAETLGTWFDTPNPALSGFKPIEVIERGESDRLWQMIFQIKSGAHV